MRWLRRSIDPPIESARANYLTALRREAALPAMGNRWGAFREKMADFISEPKTSDEFLTFAQTQGNFDHRAAIVDTDRWAIDYSRQVLKWQSPGFDAAIDALSESKAALAGTTVDLPDRRISKILYFHASYIFSVLALRQSTTSVCEIGGGYGAPAHLWLTTPVAGTRSYTIIDLPESLFFAELFLRASGLDVRYAERPDPNASAVFLVPLGDERLCNGVKFDLVTNTLSMAELTSDWVQFWSHWLDRTSALAFYSFNYFANPVDQIFEGRNAMAPRLSKEWTLHWVRANPPISSIDIMSRRLAELLFVRRPADSAEPWLSAIGGTALSHENYAHILHRLIHRANPDDVSRFCAHVSDSFGYLPVELVELAAAGGIGDMAANLRARYETNFPKGEQFS